MGEIGASRLAAIRAAHEAGVYRTHAPSPETVHGVVGDLLAALVAREAALAGARAALGEIARHNPYPAEVFAELTAHEEEAIREAIRASGVRAPLDRTYAAWGRHVGRQYADIARAALAAGGEGGG